MAYAHQKQGKLDARAKKCMFVGYPEGIKGYSYGMKKVVLLSVLLAEMWSLEKPSTIGPRQLKRSPEKITWVATM